ncbi:hypothetical protein L484_012943 [Morus notabilis]|uniref:Uncharacterized protein n=1 Tax=Morus notabilis TaxID=981085 RepID=W9S1C4_9ROSA|nr:hypothetical protein L484_012943 [Morus notabilis]
MASSLLSPDLGRPLMTSKAWKIMRRAWVGARMRAPRLGCTAAKGARSHKGGADGLIGMAGPGFAWPG